VERGSATVETALVLPFVLLLLVALVEVFVVAGLHLRLTAAAREGARVAATAPEPEAAVAAVRATLGEPLDTRARIGVRRSAVVGSPAEVVVTLERPLVGPFLSGLVVPVRARAVMMVEP
jgi:hypothetical protein